MDHRATNSPNYEPKFIPSKDDAGGGDGRPVAGGFDGSGFRFFNPMAAGPGLPHAEDLFGERALG